LYLKQLIQINKLIYIIHKFAKVDYEKTAYEDAILGSENLSINIKACLFSQVFLVFFRC